MRKLIAVLWLFSVWAGATCEPLGAEPVISEVVQHYRITGNTAQDLRWEMNQKGPGGENGKRFDAYTGWRVNWNYRWWENSDICRLTSVTTRVRVTFTLPAWQNYSSADPGLKQKWNRYYKALYEHEKGHRDFGIQAAREIERSILNVSSRKNCDLLERDANAAAEATLDRYIILEKQYDVRTAHGAKTGAIFP